MYEIVLIANKEYLKTYDYYFVPIVGDKLSINEKTIFIVKERLLPVSNSKSIVLFGDIV